MPHLNPFAIATLITAISCLWITAIFLIYGRNFLHRLWAIFNLSIGVWAVFIIFAVTTDNPDKSYRLWRYSHVAGVYVSIFFFHFASLFCQSKNQNLILFAYIYALVHNAINLLNNGYLINIGVNYLFNSMFYLEMKLTTFLPLMFFWFLFAILGNYKLYRYYKKDPRQNKHANFLFIGSVAGYTGGITTFLPMLGFHNFYPITIITIAFYAIFNTYTVFKHQLLELKVIYRKSVIYTLLIAIVSIFYLLIVVFLEKFLQKTIGYQSVTTSVITAFFLGILIIPLRNWIQGYVDKTLFKGSPVEIAHENELLRQELARSERLKAVATLSSGLAHEIKNPLTALKTFSEYLPQKLDDKEFLSKFSKIVGSEVGRIDSLVHQLLEFAKPSPLSLKETNMHQLLEDTLNLLSSQLIKSNIKLVKEFEAGSKAILKVDPNQLRQAFLNIFLNAIEAMEKGGTLTVKTRVEGLGDRGPYSMLLISIEDTGCGIAPKDLPHIFDPFFSKKDGGTGLGLSITHQIIQEHGGKITARSEIGKGTEFGIELPLSSH